VANNGVVQTCPLGGKRVKKGVGLDRLRFAYWNVGTLTSKSIQLVKNLHGREVHIACIQETKWVGAKAREIDGYKLCYSSGTKARNGFGILVVTSRLIEL